MIIKGIKIKENLGKLYTSHTMTTFLSFSSNLVNWVQSMKDAGYNNIWAYTDYYQGGEVANIANLLDACQTVGGITVTVGAHGANNGQKDIDMMLDTKDHPAMLRINGKPVYTYYSWRSNLYANTMNLLAANGLSRNDYVLLVNTLYAFEITWQVTNPNTGGNLLTEFRNGTVTSPYTIHYSGDGYDYDQAYYFYNDAVIIRDYAASPHADDKGIPYMLDSYGIDGLVDFAVDKGSGNSINENNWVNASAVSKNKKYMGGVSAFYASVSFFDYGFTEAADIWQEVIDTPSANRPALMNDTTSDDYVELSYMSPLLTSVVNGLSYIPDPSAGFHLGDNTRFILTDHTGIQKFLRPFINAYKSGATSINITTEKIFVWYWLHPVDAPLLTTIPNEVSALGSHFNQTWWSNTLYAQGNQNVPGIKTQLADKVGLIRMAVHLTSSAYLRIVINGTTYTSTLKQAGLAYWECPQALGTPVFSIINSDGTVRKTGNGLQPITNSCYPGGWNPLIVEI